MPGLLSPLLDSQAALAAWLAGAVAFAACVVIVMTQRWHGRFTLDGVDGVQKFHLAPTPRIGGLGVVLGLAAAWGALAPAPAEQLGILLLAGLPAFASGLGEDLTGKVSVRTRLLATLASGALAWWLAGATLQRVDIPWIDAALAWAPLSLLFTGFAVGGVANAINIIDGFNGLAAGVLMIVLAALGLLALGAGDPQLATICLVIGAAVLGFGLVNFPLGKIFLGDGGAYLLGYLLATLAVLVCLRNPEISPWAGLMACAYPILEVLFSVWRRTRRQHPAGHPDRLHLHSLIKRRFVRKAFRGLPPALMNSAVSPVVWSLAAAPAACAVLFRDSTLQLMALFLLFALLYAILYGRLVHFAWRRVWRRPSPSAALSR